eukprot:3735912-Alexandrium_andersonii.AAC.1
MVLILVLFEQQYNVSVHAGVLHDMTSVVEPSMREVLAAFISAFRRAVRTLVHPDDRHHFLLPSTGAHALGSLGVKGFLCVTGVWPMLPLRTLHGAIFDVMEIRPDLPANWK